MYSVTFGETTSESLNIIGATKVIGSPKPKTTTISVPGSDVTLDFTEAFGGVHYENRTITLTFLSLEPWSDQMAQDSTVKNALHGKKFNIVFSDDEDWYYVGRVSVGNWEYYKGAGKVVVTINADPYKYSADGTVVEWSPDDVESGDIVTFEAGGEYPLSNVSFPLAPVQDLHGYNSPWPAGGGKNKFEVVSFSVSEMNGITFTYNSDGSVTVNGTATARAYKYLRTYSAGWFPVGTTYTFRLAGVPSTASAAFLNFAYSDDGTYYAGSYGTLTYEGTKTITSAHQYNSVLLDIPAGQSFNNNKIYVNAEVGTTASAWTPYSNICPISGRTGADIYRTGAELLDRVTLSPGYITADGTVTPIDPLTNTFCYSDFIPVEAGKDYLWQGICANANYKRIHGYNADKQWVEQLWYSDPQPQRDDLYLAEITIPSDIAYVRLSFRSDDRDVIFRQGNVIALNWQTEAGTVYGGTLDVTTGLLTVTHKSIKVSEMLDVSYETTNQRFNCRIVGMKKAPQRTLDLVSSELRTQIGGSFDINWDNCIYNNNGTDYVLIHAHAYTDAAAMQTALADVQVVYPLATPLTYTLTTAELTTLLGQNNVWCDAGEISLPLPYVTLTNERKAVTPTINAEQAATITFDGTSVSVSAGESVIPQLVLDSSSKEVGVASMGAVTFSYREGSL